MTPRTPVIEQFSRLSPASRLALAVFRVRAAERPAGIPGSLFLGLTSRCSLACLHCKYRGGAGASDLPYGLALGALREAAALGVPKAVFFGGEPLLYPRLAELAGAARDLGLFTELDTNGQELTAGRARALARAGLSSVMVSLHSPSPAEHDRLCGRGTFRRAARALAAALNAGLVTYVSSCVFAAGPGARELRGLLAFARSSGAHGARFLPYSPRAGASRLPAALAAALRREDPAGFAGTCLARGRSGCAAQRADILYLGSSGDLRACPYAMASLGSFPRCTLAAALRRSGRPARGPVRPCQKRA
ncbi:MAG: radical SAM protein [Elusimicrobiales bacterium]|nr:radical SAM protein [Elusimicrobiales bacterium]